MSVHTEPAEAQGEPVLSEPARMLSELEASATGHGQEAEPNRLPIKAITVAPELFQLRRGICEKHVSTLRIALRDHGEFDPLLVLRHGERVYLVDGHHRLEAYRRARVTDPIPVAFFIGTPAEAVLAAGKGNSRAKLPMDNKEKHDAAWRLVCMSRFTVPEIKTASGVSERNVRTMRKVLRALGPNAHEHPTWWHARRAYQGLGKYWEPDEADSLLEAQAQQYADRLAKAFSSKLSNNVEVAARALAIYFGRALPGLLAVLSAEHVAEAEDPDAEY